MTQETLTRSTIVSYFGNQPVASLSYGVHAHDTFFVALRNGDVQTVKELLAEHPAFVLCKEPGGFSPRGFTALHCASELGHKEIVDELLSVALETRHNIINAVDEYRRTPVYLAALNGHRDIVATLCTFGAAITITTTAGRNVLHAAASHGHSATVQLILSAAGLQQQGPSDFELSDEKIQQTPLHLACKSGSLETVQALVEAKFDTQQGDANGDSIFHICARYGHSHIIKWLTEAAPACGNLVKSFNLKMEDPLEIACRWGHWGTVLLLAQKGTDEKKADLSLTSDPERQKKLRTVLHGSIRQELNEHMINDLASIVLGYLNFGNTDNGVASMGISHAPTFASVPNTPAAISPRRSLQKGATSRATQEQIQKTLHRQRNFMSGHM